MSVEATTLEEKEHRAKGEGKANSTTKLYHS